MTLNLDSERTRAAVAAHNIKVEENIKVARDEFLLRRETRNEGRVFFKLNIETRGWDSIAFAEIKPGDRITYIVKPDNERSGIFIALTSPYYDHHHGLVCKTKKFSMPPEETVTFQEIRQMCNNSGMVPVFVERDNGEMVSVSSLHLGENGSLVLKIPC